MAYLLDGIVLGLFALMVYTGIKGGFIKTISGVLTFVYEMLIFFCALLLAQTHFSRILVAVFTGTLTLIAIPVYYPIANAIDKIGGETW